ncbi:MAG: HAMP domain-containing protein [Streptosporangiales bacterium]|nr:HAMP domain-containing protein [Streptosporangiales bacterium]
MTLRTRVTLAAGLAVLLAVVAVSITVFVVMRGNLYDQIDKSLSHDGRAAEAAKQHRSARDTSTVPRGLPLAHDVFRQVVDRDGDVVTMYGDRQLPVTPEVLAVARGKRVESFFDTEVDGTPVRVHVTAAGQGTALQIGRSLSEVEQALRRLLVVLIAISVVAVGLAAVIGRLVAAAATAPVHRVAEAADAVAQTGELSHHIAVPSGDDLGRLAASFNTMLDALSESLAQQRQLVADASHELRTPLATVRANVELLTRADELPPDEKAMLIGDTVVQIGELTRLVGDLVELARGDGQQEPFTIVDLDDLTRQLVDLARDHHPSIAFRVDGAQTLVRGAPTRVSRAVSNLIDNAAKWSPPEATVEIAVHDGTVTVTDHGPGIDLPHIFDRFYRSPGARTLPGSGLGLAIVKQVADSHDGTVEATTAADGGAVFTLHLPTAAGDADATDRDGRHGLSSTS